MEETEKDDLHGIKALGENKLDGFENAHVICAIKQPDSELQEIKESGDCADCFLQLLFR